VRAPTTSQEDEMAKSRSQERLVPVDALPERTRRGKYARVLEEFLAGRARYARYETPTEAGNAAAALRKAAAKRGLPVQVSVVSGEVYLSKK
jgi:hypothetical protein